MHELALLTIYCVVTLYVSQHTNGLAIYFCYSRNVHSYSTLGIDTKYAYSGLVPFLAPPLYTAPDDYTAISSQPVTFSSAPDQMCITIGISDDGVVEETESFVVTLVTEDPAVHIVLPFASVTITDSTGTYLVLLGEGSFIHTLSFHSCLAITVVLWQLNDPKIACIASAMKNKITPA